MASILSFEEDMMKSARQTLIDILESRPNKKMDITELAKKMNTAGVMGFGVEIEHVVNALRREGRVDYNHENGEVALKK